MSNMPLPRQTFGKDKRILTSQMFQQVFDKAVFRISARNFLILALPNELGRARLGLVIGKKNIRFAVNRNRIKRFARETFRHQHLYLPALDIIFLARRGLDQPNINMAEIFTGAWVKLRQEAEQV